ncbi:MAG: exosome complex protein Rrp4 [archaeon]|nr:exosome complex protein Rrp4 [archaeon]
MSEKKIVVPGDLVTEQRTRLGSHVFTENGKVYSDALGLVYEDRDSAAVVPLRGKYIPRRGDIIVGIVESEKFSVYGVAINSIYASYVSKQEVRDRLKRGAVISAKVFDVNEINEAKMEDLRVFYGGEILSVTPVKIPRVIGKSGSMLAQLKDGTGCNILVGRNGWIWAKGGDTKLLKEALDLIEREAHLSNLTNKVGDFLRKKKVTK